LRKNDVIEPLNLTINERVRQFGGHQLYSNFLMYLGLAVWVYSSKISFFSTDYVSCNQRKMLNFVDSKGNADYIVFPRKIGDVEVVKNFKDLDCFVDTLFPKLDSSMEIPETIVLTPKNDSMYEINNMCLERFKKDVEPEILMSTDKPFVPGNFSFDILDVSILRI